MKKPAGGSPIVEGGLLMANKSETINIRSTCLGSTGTQAGLPHGEWSVAKAIGIAKTLWGDQAATVAAWAALSAHCEGDRPEFRFWFEVFVDLRAGASDSGPEDAMPRARRRSFD